jgi:hypothetical protein
MTAIAASTPIQVLDFHQPLDDDAADGESDAFLVGATTTGRFLSRSFFPDLRLSRANVASQKMRFPPTDSG